MSLKKFDPVSKSDPCPICGKTDWCMISKDRCMCLCHRTPSQKPTESGEGWYHRLKDAPAPFVPVRHAPPQSDETSELAAKYFAALPRGIAQVRLSRHLMRTLSLPCDIFIAHDVRWDAKAKAAAFPMRDAEGKVTGIRYRDVFTGKKWSLKGSKDGLFYVPGFFDVQEKELVVCEGPTDMLAAVCCGVMNVVGRSCCTAGAAHVRNMMRRYKADTLTIVADADPEKTRPDGSTYRPGIDGAEKLARDVGAAFRIVLPAPNFKDLRAWYEKGGMTGDAFRKILASAKWRLPELEEGELK